MRYFVNLYFFQKLISKNVMFFFFSFFSHKNDYVKFSTEILNLEGHPNHITGSRVMAEVGVWGGGSKTARFNNLGKKLDPPFFDNCVIPYQY